MLVDNFFFVTMDFQAESTINAQKSNNIFGLRIIFLKYSTPDQNVFIIANLKSKCHKLL